ncbi:hypothetical protein N7448_004971 [Penicillium atrosanguineum]|uniref:NAD(P)-binding domain-containing protein n=1 Tax=Penicillium atrosanguineum TaxID=1132637 RepID=A0A9W9H2J6_9EURO|nr:Major facilitator superfamily domain general substrate transporter [Penicillium atrosanguineum]KAJ5125653.1 hypothetical protein N7526_007830 [Penicillium atrosanguineum]KAJ5136417.1 hypothetical protein N7448_004971 [Penicillium atrosanguineum]KAJ5292748.1 Major facilitator superfamily domain general substrate transporter [Penicillium atrosanguineum]KAJ5303212.1 hypothetical protein N7476_010011 [Penicillium atrosanguineum]
MASLRKVIVFGATGSVGSAAALKAFQEGAKVTLAMRDPSKPIPRLDGISVEKVQADLTQPDTVFNAARQSDAKTAFIYAVWGTTDGMRSTLEALKKGGVESVVFLSSFAVKGDPHAIKPADIIAYVHAQIEIALADVFGDQRSSLRPAYFSSNVFQYKDEILQGEVALPNPDVEFDWISPEDIGEVAGSILAHGLQENVIPLVGPERLSLKDGLSLVGDTLGKEIKTPVVGKEQAIKDMQRNGNPEGIATWFVETVTSPKSFIWDAPTWEAGRDNIQKYTHKAPTMFRQWLDDNKGFFAA